MEGERERALPLFGRVPGEGRQAREQLEEDDAERPPVDREAARSLVSVKARMSEDSQYNIIIQSLVRSGSG